MTAVQAPAPPPKPPAPPTFRACRGLVFFRMRPIKLKDGTQKPGIVIARMRDEADPPLYGAEAWKPAGGRWSTDFGGRRLEKGDGRLIWEWL